MKPRRITLPLCVLAFWVLSSPLFASLLLFDGFSFDNWTYHSKDLTVNPYKVWNYKDGEIHSMGQPAGFIRTVKEYNSYILDFEWQWVESSGAVMRKGGLLLVSGEVKKDDSLPNGLRVDLTDGKLGNIILNGVRLELDKDDDKKRKEGKIIKALPHDAVVYDDRWNRMQIYVLGDTFRVMMNGVLINKGVRLAPERGAISFIVEGSPIRFQDVLIVEQ